MALSTIDYTGISQLTGPIGSAANIPLTLQVNGGTTVVTADTSGNLYVGTTNQLATGFTNKLNVNGSIVGGSASATSGSVLLQNIYANGSTTNFGTEQSSGGPFIGCYVYPGSPAGTFLSSVNFGNTTSGSYVISSGNHKWYIGSTQNLATIGQTVTMTQALTLNTSGNLVFGTANAGIVFNNSSASVNSTLNDYEVGTWTPAINATGVSYSSQIGTYTKVGRAVTVQFYLTFTTWSSASGNIVVSGLPFTSLTTASTYEEYSIPYFTNVTLPSGCTVLGGELSPNSNGLLLYGVGSAVAGYSPLQYGTAITNSGTGKLLLATLTYQANF